MHYYFSCYRQEIEASQFVTNCKFWRINHHLFIEGKTVTNNIKLNTVSSFYSKKCFNSIKTIKHNSMQKKIKGKLMNSQYYK